MGLSKPHNWHCYNCGRDNGQDYAECWGCGMSREEQAALIAQVERKFSDPRPLRSKLSDAPPRKLVSYLRRNNKVRAMHHETGVYGPQSGVAHDKGRRNKWVSVARGVSEAAAIIGAILLCVGFVMWAVDTMGRYQ